MYVRKTTNTELIARLDLKVFGKSETEDDYDDPAYVWWLAYVDGAIAGFAGLKLFTERGVQMGYLARAGVLPKFRGLGIQRALIKCRDREAERQQVAMTTTYTAKGHYASANNLIRCGYELYTPEGAYGLKDALYFCKDFKY